MLVIFKEINTWSIDYSMLCLLCLIVDEINKEPFMVTLKHDWWCPAHELYESMRYECEFEELEIRNSEHCTLSQWTTQKKNNTDLTAILFEVQKSLANLSGASYRTWQTPCKRPFENIAYARSNLSQNPSQTLSWETFYF